MVSDKLLVKFKIGHYFDEVLCDIMPMDCCHILLGRTWKYDRYAVYDWRLNQYTLWVNGKKQKLLYLIEIQNEVVGMFKWEEYFWEGGGVNQK